MSEHPSRDNLALARLKSLPRTVGRGPVPRHANAPKQDLQDTDKAGFTRFTRFTRLSEGVHNAVSVANTGTHRARPCSSGSPDPERAGSGDPALQGG